eukprot:CAMPEP_0197912346 /NCGR_PEP_ID=MMETSP1439-20131203/74548_1 /TAXON_ID=66791 /ORGANISM="Gonyaulax spinifera, Strain CCMP409" /LENGTH=476 /DNA_ID=CAMNT_0043534123 /DNA_START=59 /DNA_END=1489 /DNA_ORIENTATION=-
MGCCRGPPMLAVFLLASRPLGTVAGTCPGSVQVKGHGQVSLINAKWNLKGQAAGSVKAPDSQTVEPHMNGRTYFGDACTDGSYANKQYTALKLLGKTLRYTTDMSGAGCGCNAALYLTSLHQNSQLSDCEDYYCDANSVCGVPCAEIDIQEANQHAWHSTLHMQDDGEGIGVGLGGKATNWAKEDYGPGGRCIDTTKPFEVAVSFPQDKHGDLASMYVELTQRGSPCPLTASISSYSNGRDGMPEMKAALVAGMTPIISFWASDDMLWMDGIGKGAGECASDSAAACPDSVKFYNMSIEDALVMEPFCERCPMGHCDRGPDGTCDWFEGEWLKGLESFHCRVPSCDGVPTGPHLSKCWSWKEKHYFSIKDKNHPCKPPPPPTVPEQILDVIHILMMWKIPGEPGRVNAAGTPTAMVVLPALAAVAAGMAAVGLAAAGCRRAAVGAAFRRRALGSEADLASDPAAAPCLHPEADLQA